MTTPETPVTDTRGKTEVCGLRTRAAGRPPLSVCVTGSRREDAVLPTLNPPLKGQIGAPIGLIKPTHAHHLGER